MKKTIWISIIAILFVVGIAQANIFDDISNFFFKKTTEEEAAGGTIRTLPMFKSGGEGALILPRQSTDQIIFGKTTTESVDTILEVEGDSLFEGTVSVSGDFEASGSLKFPLLPNCDTMDTDASGYVSCGTDDTGAEEVAAHDLLSDIHSDTTEASASQGSFIFSKIVDSWEEFAAGASYSLIQYNGTIPVIADDLRLASAGFDTLWANALTLGTDLDMKGWNIYDSTANLGLDDLVSISDGMTIAGGMNIDSGTFYVDAATDRVGIGTTNPSESFHIMGDIQLGNVSNGDGIVAYDSTPYHIFSLTRQDAINTADAVLTTYSGFGVAVNEITAPELGGDYAFYIENSGNVGIGDTDPQYTLSVDGTASISDDWYWGDSMLWGDMSGNEIFASAQLVWDNTVSTSGLASYGGGITVSGSVSFDDDAIAEDNIAFSTACVAGNHYYLNGNDLACEADDDTTYTVSGDPLDLVGTQIDLHIASTGGSGYLSNTDWDTFNAKQSAISINGDPLGFSGNVLDIWYASASGNGYLTAANWTTFNNKWDALTDMVLTDNYIYVGDASNDPVGVAMSNDCSIASNGTITCDHDALNNFVANEHINWTAATNHLITSGNLNVSGSVNFDSTVSVSGALTLDDGSNFLIEINNYTDRGAGIFVTDDEAAKEVYLLDDNTDSTAYFFSGTNAEAYLGYDAGNEDIAGYFTNTGVKVRLGLLDEIAISVSGSAKFGDGVSISDDLTVANNLDVDGMASVSDIRHGQRFEGSIDIQAITAASDTIRSDQGFVSIDPDSDYLMTSQPTIASGSQGQWLMIHNEDEIFEITLQDNTILSGTSIIHGGSSGVIAPEDTVTFYWFEESGEKGWHVQSHPNTQVAGNAESVNVRNTSGSTIAKGKPVYVTGYNAGQDRVTVDLADADDPTKMPTFGLTNVQMLNNANGTVVVNGMIVGMDTSGFSVGDVIWVDTTAGGLTNTRPTVNDIQPLGGIGRSHASQGTFLVVGVGRDRLPASGTMLDLTITDFLTTSGAVNFDGIVSVSKTFTVNGIAYTSKWDALGDITLNRGFILRGSSGNVAEAFDTGASNSFVLSDGTAVVISDIGGIGIAGFSGYVNWAGASAGTIHTDNYVENVVDTLAATLGAGADGNDVDITSLGKLEFFDTGLYIDADADGVMDITSDGTLELHSADWDISTTGVITNAAIDDDNNAITNIDGENITNDTIDNDSIDWADMLDLDTDGAVIWGNIAAGELADNSIIDADIDDDGNFVFTGAWDFGGAVIEITNSANPTVDTEGEIAIDSTSDQLLYFSGGEIHTFVSSRSFSINFSSLSFEVAPAFNRRMHEAGTITGINCVVDGGTSQVAELVICDGITCKDTGSVDASVTCAATNTADDGSLASPSFGAGDYLKASVSDGDTTGEVDWLIFNVDYIYTRE